MVNANCVCQYFIEIRLYKGHDSGKIVLKVIVTHTGETSNSSCSKYGFFQCREYPCINEKLKLTGNTQVLSFVADLFKCCFLDNVNKTIMYISKQCESRNT